MKFEQFKRHFPEEISPDIEKYVDDVVLKNSRYVFIQIAARQKFAYCTHCHRSHAVDMPYTKLKHKQEDTYTCPLCMSKCHVRFAAYGRKYMVDRAVFVWYEKSLINPKAITARVISAHRDYSGDFKNVKTEYYCGNMYLFEPGKSMYFHHGIVWNKRSTVFSAFDSHYSGWGNWRRHRSDKNIKKAVKGTPFQHSQWEQYTRYQNPDYISDMVEFFDLAARYPAVEYLTKLGFKSLVSAKLHSEPTYGAIHWNGKTAEKVLRLPLERVKEIRKSGLSFSPVQLKYFQMKVKSGENISAKDAHVLAEIDFEDYPGAGHYRSILKEMSALAPRDEIISYLLKQYRREKESISIGSTLTDYRDYLKQCRELGMDLRERRYLFPNNLQKEHDKLTKRIKLKEDRAINLLIQSRLEYLNELIFEWNGLIAKPFTSTIELFDEAKKLNHCVGNYSKWYAEGKTNLFSVRRVDEPDKPFFTLEFFEAEVRQCRGRNNCDMTKEVRKFVDAFIKEKLKKNTRKAKIRQEVAV